MEVTTNYFLCMLTYNSPVVDSMEADVNESLKTIVRKVCDKNWRNPAYVAREKSVISPEK